MPVPKGPLSIFHQIIPEATRRGGCSGTEWCDEFAPRLWKWSHAQNSINCQVHGSGRGVLGEEGFPLNIGMSWILTHLMNKQ